MANGDQPPAVTVTIKAVHGGESELTIPCHTVEQEQRIDALVLAIVNALRIAYSPE